MSQSSSNDARASSRDAHASPGDAEASSSDGPAAEDVSPQGQALPALFHRLNNQLGIVLAHAELLEARASDAANRERAAQVVASALVALGTVREIRQRTVPSD